MLARESAPQHGPRGPGRGPQQRERDPPVQPLGERGDQRCGAQDGHRPAGHGPAHDPGTVAWRADVGGQRIGGRQRRSRGGAGQQSHGHHGLIGSQQQWCTPCQPECQQSTRQHPGTRPVPGRQRDRRRRDGQRKTVDRRQSPRLGDRHTQIPGDVGQQWRQCEQGGADHRHGRHQRRQQPRIGPGVERRARARGRHCAPDLRAARGMPAPLAGRLPDGEAPSGTPSGGAAT